MSDRSKTQYRKSGRSAGSNQQRTSSGSYDPEDPSKAIHFQFGSIAMQVCQDPYKLVPNIPAPSVPKQQLPRKDAGAPDQSGTGEVHQVPMVKKDPQVSLPPTTSQTQNPSVLPLPMTSMQMPHSQNVTATSLPLPMPIPFQMGNPPPVQQHMFVPGLQPHPMQPQGLMHQGQGMGFTTQMGSPQLPLQLGNMGMGKTPQYLQQLGGKFGGFSGKTVVKITHPDTHKEVRLDERVDTYPDGRVLGPRSQSQTIPSFAHAHPINYYPNSYCAGSIYYPAPESLLLTSSQITPNTQMMVGEGTQNVSFMNPNLNSPPISKAGTSMPGVVEPPNLNRSKRSAARGKKKRKEILQKADAAGTTSSSKDKTVVELNRSKSSTAGGKVGIHKPSRPSGEATASHPLMDSETVPEESSQHEKPSSEPSLSKSLEGATTQSAVVSCPVSTESLASNSLRTTPSEESVLKATTVCNEVPILGGGLGESARTATEADNMDVSTSGIVDSTDVESSHGNNISTVDTSSSRSNVIQQQSAPVSAPEFPETIPKYETNVLDNSGVGSVLLPVASSKDKPVVESNRSKSSTVRGKKKRKEILQKAVAAWTTSDLYMAYKCYEKKKETVPSESAESTPTVGNSKQEPVDIIHVDAVPIEKSGLSKAVPDDWEDAADISTPKLEPSYGREQASGVHRDEDGNRNVGKKYSRDFLLKFSEQCSDLSEGFEIVTDIAEALMSGNINVSHLVDRSSFPSPVRVMDRHSGGARADHRGSVMVDDDRCGRLPGPSLGRDLLLDVGYSANAGFRPGQGSNYGVLMNPHAQIDMQYPGGILPRPTQPMSPQVGVQRNSPVTERWQRIANFQQRGILPSPQTPLQMMHKADRKYEAGKMQDEEEAKQRWVKSILDKLTPQNFEKIVEQVKAVNIDNAITLTGVISQIFDKALMEPTFCEMYANFCSYLAGELPDFSEDNEKITFKRLLLNKCQEEFERGEREQEEANKAFNEGRIKQTEEEREEKKIKDRRRMLGNIRLIGELYKKKMLTEKVMHGCIMQLMGQYDNPDEEDVEALCELMSTIGKMIDHPKAKEHMDAYFDKMAKLSNNMKLSSRVRFMLKDAIELRENKWQQRRKVEEPKKIEEEHRDAAQERKAQASRLARGPSMNSPTRRVPMDFGPRGLFSPTNQMGSFSGIPTQNRGGYDTQDIRFEDRQSYEARTLSVPLPQRQTGDDSITLGPQGGLARGMSIRGPPMMSSNTLPDISPNAGEPRRMTAGLNGFSSLSELPAYGSREDVILRYQLDRFSAPPAFDQLSAQEHNTNYGNRDIRTHERGFDRHLATSPPIRGQAPAVTPYIPSEKAWPEKCLQDMSMAAIKEFSSVFVMSSRKDPVWKYGQEIDREGSKGYKCNFCLKILKGGVFRMKEHLAGVHGNVAPCRLVPPEVRDEIINYMEKHYEAKKVAQIYKEERIDQGVSLHNKSSSGLATSVPRRRVRRPMDRFLQSVKEGEEGNPMVITGSEELRDRTVQDIGRFFFENGIAFNVVNSPSFINMLRSIGNFGRGLKPPTSFELSTTILNKEVATIKQVVHSMKKSWKQTGVSIMSVECKDMRGRQLINFLVNNPSGTVFLKSVDASDVVKDANLLFKLLDKIVEEVGEDIVVQVVTDNASNYKKAGELLMQKRTRLWWTPCATHCIDLMLEDIGKLPQHKNALIKAKKVSTFIYNRGAVLALMRSFTEKELVRPAPTRFTTAYLTLQSMYSLKQNLEQMFTSKEWNELSLSKKPEGREVKKIILSDRFWISMAYALKTTKPIVNVLRMMDREKMPGMGFIYGAIDKAKEEIAKNLGDEVGAYKEIWKIIDDRWELQMHCHLHAAAYFLNPQIQYLDNPSKHPKIKLGFFICMDKLMTNDEDKTKADLQVDAFLKRTGMFSFGQAKHSIFNRSPADWWSQYGDQTPELQSLAVKILSLTCSSFGCERNWSAFNFIHIKRRNTLSTQKLNSLMYVMYNKKLQYKFLKKQSLKRDEDPLVGDEIPSDDEWVVAEDNIEETSSEGFVGVDISHPSGSRPLVEKRYQGEGKALQLVDEEPEWEDNTSDSLEDDRGIRYDDDSLEGDTSDNDGGDDILDPLFRPLDTNDSIFRD